MEVKICMQTSISCSVEEGIRNRTEWKREREREATGEVFAFFCLQLLRYLLLPYDIPEEKKRGWVGKQRTPTTKNVYQ